MKANLATLVVGVLFGFTLGWAQLHDPAVIYAMLRLREPDVFLLMGIAIATAALGARALFKGAAPTPAEMPREAVGAASPGL